MESEKEAGSEGEDDDEEVCDAFIGEIQWLFFESPIKHAVCPPNFAWVIKDL